MKNKNLLKNTFTVGAFTALSRVLGLIREMLQARFIGAGIEQSAFTLAFALPNMARKLFGEGALTAAFVPVFRDEVERTSLEKASALARAVLTTVMLMLLAMLLLAMGALEGIVSFREYFAIEDESRFLLTVKLVKTLLPYMLFICGAAFGTGVLNTLGRFKASSFLPCLLNIIWISALGFISFHDAFASSRYTAADRVFRIAVAILSAGALQLAFVFWRMSRAGVSPRFTFSGWFTPSVRRVWRNLGIAALGAGAIQINYMLDQVLAQLASPWAAGVIGYAERLMDLPLGIIGVAFGTVLLPTFAGLFAKGDIASARETLGASISSLMFVMIPSAVGLCLLATEVTRVIYEGGDFDPIATMRVSRALAVYSLGLAFFGYQKSLVPWFQAQNDMKTPLRVSLITVVMNAALNIASVIFLPEEWRHVGLATSTVFCAAFGCLLLTIFAKRKNGSLGLREHIANVVRMTIAALAMGALLAIAKFCFSRFATANFSSILQLAILVAIGIVVYALLAIWLLPDSSRALLARFKRKRL